MQVLKTRQIILSKLQWMLTILVKDVFCKILDIKWKYSHCYVSGISWLKIPPGDGLECGGCDMFTLMNTNWTAARTSTLHYLCLRSIVQTCWSILGWIFLYQIPKYTNASKSTKSPIMSDNIRSYLSRMATFLLIFTVNSAPKSF